MRFERIGRYTVNTDLSFLLDVGNQQYPGFALGFDPNTFEITSWQIVLPNPNALQVWEGVKNRKGLTGDMSGNYRQVGTNRENQVVTTEYNRFDGTGITGTTIFDSPAPNGDRHRVAQTFSGTYTCDNLGLCDANIAGDLQDSQAVLQRTDTGFNFLQVFEDPSNNNLGYIRVSQRTNCADRAVS